MKSFKKFVIEAEHPDILPPKGAGNDGTDELVKTYANDTPGQNHKYLLKQIKPKKLSPRPV